MSDANPSPLGTPAPDPAQPALTPDASAGAGPASGAPHPSPQGAGGAAHAEQAAAQAASILDAALLQRQALFRNLEAQRSGVYRIIDEQKVEALRAGTGAPGPVPAANMQAAAQAEGTAAGGRAPKGPETLGGAPLHPLAGNPAAILQALAEPRRTTQALLVQELITVLRHFIAQEVQACLAARHQSAERPQMAAGERDERPADMPS